MDSGLATIYGRSHRYNMNNLNAPSLLLIFQSPPGTLKRATLPVLDVFLMLPMSLEVIHRQMHLSLLQMTHKVIGSYSDWSSDAVPMQCSLFHANKGSSQSSES